MGASKKLKMVMLAKDVTVAELAKRTGKAVHTVYNALSADNFMFQNLKMYADALDCDVVLIDRKTGKIY